MLSSRLPPLCSLVRARSPCFSFSGSRAVVSSHFSAVPACIRSGIGAFRPGVRFWTSSSSSGSRPAYYRDVNRIRSSFLGFFKDHGHLVVPSSNIVPGNDPSLLFTSAGMVQFKESFLGLRPPAHGAITTVQKCVRAGGKHNDLDNVGFTARHHTFFEMLGNFSFGAYDKREAIRLAWLYLTKELGLPKERLSVTVLNGDQDTRKAWKDVAGFTDDALIRECGEEDNFWSMGDVGPCGPCSEIFWDQLQPVDGERYLEIWNLVFMQKRASKVTNLDGTTSTVINDLPTPCIDTGMGLERLASVLQGKRENYKIDTLDALLVQTQRVIENSLGKALSIGDAQTDAALRVIVDHLRSSSFLLAEGLMPGNQGRGYVLRRIIRRATRYAYLLGMNEPILASIFPVLAETMRDAYPELYERREHITNTLTHEELSFFGNLHRGMDVFVKLLSSQTLASSRVIPGEQLFDLYETYGFPVDLTDLMAKEKGWSVDLEGFHRVFDEQRKKDRLTWRGSGDSSVPSEMSQWTVTPKFTGYETLEEPKAEVLEAFKAADNEFWVSIDPCPFYAESGGQVGDRGILVASGGHIFEVLDTIAPYPKGISLKVKPAGVIRSGSLSSNHASSSADGRKAGDEDNGEHLTADRAFELLARGSTVHASVDSTWRRSVRRNHTATHLLHSALRSVLGDHVVQAGSRVAQDLLRFDFVHYDPLSADQISAVEALVNQAIDEGVPLRTQMETYEEAIAKGAMALFSEKYDKTSQLRMIDVPGHSIELCGGTHVSSTSDIGLFKITNQGSAGTGTRRVEAMTGTAAIQWLSNRSSMVDRISEILNSRADIPSIPSKIERLLQIRKDSLKEIDALKEQLVRSACSSPYSSSLSSSSSSSSSGLDKITSYSKYEGSHAGVAFMIHHFKPGGTLASMDLKSLRTAGDKAREDYPEKTHALVTEEAIVICSVKPPTKDYLKSLMVELGIPGGGPAGMVSGSIAKAGVEKTLVDLIRLSNAS